MVVVVMMFSKGDYSLFSSASGTEIINQGEELKDEVSRGTWRRWWQS